MKSGSWHQCGASSQTIVDQLLRDGVGQGVVLSPRDLPQHKAVEWSKKFSASGAEILIDQQFYEPNFSNDQLSSYPTSPFRVPVANLHSISDADLVNLSGALVDINGAVGATAVLAPAVPYEAARSDIIQLNTRLFAAACAAGKALGIPTFATVLIGQSAIDADSIVDGLLSHATSLDADGWYFGFEFSSDEKRARVPTSLERLTRCSSAVMTLACTGRPVLHAFAGQVGILSLASGATAAAVGHSQNLWQFTRQRWQPTVPQSGGPGKAPTRLFSSALYSTIVYPDETAQLPPALKSAIMTKSPYSAGALSGGKFARGDGNKHLVYTLANELNTISTQPSARDRAAEAIKRLNIAISNHEAVAKAGVSVRDDAYSYQRTFKTVIEWMLQNRATDYDYLELL